MRTFADEEILAEAMAMRDWLVDLRRELHRIPERGNEEFKTSDAVARRLDTLGIEYVRRDTSIVALVRGALPGGTVAVRADMDALPIQERRTAPWASEHPGMMHACGHDAHTAMALGTARLFAGRRDSLAGNVKFLFQPAEETSGGALPMIEAGCLENPHVDAVIGLHVMPHVPTGSVEVKYGALNGASDTLHITVRGRSAHGATPDLGVDAVMISGLLVSALHTLVSRSVSPLDAAVLSVGTLHGGVTSNIIADEVTMRATLRTVDPVTEERLLGEVERIVLGLPPLFGGVGELGIERGYRSLVNHDRVVDAMVRVASRIVGEDRIVHREKPSMGVEDFSYFIRERPGAFFHLGCRNEALGITAPLHNGMFDIDEDCLPIGVAMHVGTVLELLGG